MSTEKPRIAILGAGPTGLDLALAASEHGFPFTLYESAPTVAGHVDSWGHVRLFTPWSMNASPRMRQHLAAAGHQVPDSTEDCPTGRELVDQLFRPLADLPELRDHLQFGHRVERVGRQGLLKHEEIGSAERARRPFLLLVREPEGGQRVDEFDVVFDCTGNTRPNALGDGGIPVPGEDDLDDALTHDIPNLETEANQWVGKTVLLVGNGHSAQTALRDLLDLAETSNTRVIWALRRNGSTQTDDADPLPERGELHTFAAKVLADPPPALDIKQEVTLRSIHRGQRIDVELAHADGTTETVEVDRILALTGKVGDHQLYRQLQVHECYATSGPMKLAAALLSSGETGGDCLDQTSQGAETLVNPEPGFFILGIKSYGRRNDYLLQVGWQQVDEVFSLLEQ